MTKKCESCDEREMHPKSELGWCLACERDGAAEAGCWATDECRGLVYNDVPADWEPGQSLENTMCESCAIAFDKQKEMSDLQSQFESVVMDSGWTIQSTHHAQTGTQYVDIWSDCALCEEGGHSLKVRLGDHATAYCSEDISLVTGQNGGGDDHTIQSLTHHLAKLKAGECYECE